VLQLSLVDGGTPRKSRQRRSQLSPGTVLDPAGEADYAALYKLAPNLKYAFESVDTAFAEARTEPQAKLQKEKKAHGL
jgi:hypothetical protein